MKKKLNQPTESKPPTEKVFTLPGYLFEDVQNLENAKREMQMELKLIESEYQRKAAEIQGLEASIYVFFRSDALANKRILPGQTIEFLGDFNYRVVNAKKEEPPKEPDTTSDNSGIETPEEPKDSKPV